MSENNFNRSDSNIESNVDKSDIISRFPFHGKSKYLIDKLYIIGYDNYTINKILNNIKILKESKNQEIDTSSKSSKVTRMYSSKLTQSINKENLIYDNIKQTTISEHPSLLNEIVNDYNKTALDVDMTIQMIFPNKPIYYSVINFFESTNRRKN